MVFSNCKPITLLSVPGKYLPVFCLGVAHLVVHGTSGSTSYETIPPVRLESSGGVLSTVDMVVQRRDGPRRLRELDSTSCVVVSDPARLNQGAVHGAEATDPGGG